MASYLKCDGCGQLYDVTPQSINLGGTPIANRIFVQVGNVQFDGNACSKECFLKTTDKLANQAMSHMGKGWPDKPKPAEKTPS